MPGIDFLERRAWLESFLDGLEAAGARVLVAEIDGRPAGFLTFDPGKTTIDQLAVDPALQGRGIASRLLDRAKALSPGGLDLIVNRDNAPARCLYARRGFVEISEGRNETSGLPTIAMRWDPSSRRQGSQPAA